jgi:Ca-activated chloride channel family protein
MVDKIDEVEDAVLHFIDTTNPEDDIFLIKFSSQADLVEEFTSDRQRLRRAVGRLRAGGGTALYEAIVEGLQHLQGGRHKKKALLIITDGNDTTSNIGLEDTMETAKQSEAVLYALGIGHGEHGSFGHLPGLFKDVVEVDALKSLTDAAGGRTVLVEDAHRRGGVDLIDKAAQGVSAELRNQYTLGYYPKNKARDGSYRRIRVILRQAGMVVRTRGGYFAPRPQGN